MRGIQSTSNKTYRQIMGNGLRYEVPKYQRDYSWEQEQWDDLWHDVQPLISCDEDEHYMGILVLQTEKIKEFQIFDGQQRITTISLIILATLKCLKNLAEAGIDSQDNLKRLDNLQNSYIGYIDPVTLISNNKLKLNRNSDDYYKQQMVLLKDLPISNINSSEKQMRDCFNWFYNRIKNKFDSGEKLAAFIDNIVDKLFFTVVEVSDRLNAFLVFETLNARGLQLSSADLLKNYLFSIVDSSTAKVYELEELENLWVKIAVKLAENRFEDYLRYYWNSKNKSTSMRNLYKTIKNSVSDKASVFHLLRDLNDNADYFLAIQNPEDNFWSDKAEIRKILRSLKLFQNRQSYSLFLSAIKNLEKDHLLKLIKICSVISFRYNIIGAMNPNEQEELYNSIAVSINRDKKFNITDFKPVYINDYNFENDFCTKEFMNNSRNHKILKYIFCKIDRYLGNSDLDWESDLFTVEHILPEHADQNWGEFDLNAFKRSVYRIGNLTLLEKKLNKDAGQKSYEDKTEIFRLSICGLTNALPEAYLSWNEDKVASRQKELAKHAKAIWRIQELSN